MNYRISFDVEAKNARDAVAGLMAYMKNEQAKVKSIQAGAKIESNPLTEQEKTIVLELARTSLMDEETYDFVAEEFDLSDDCLKELQGKIERKMLTPA